MEHMEVIPYIRQLENISTYHQKVGSGYSLLCGMEVLYSSRNSIFIQMMAAKHGPGIELIHQLATHRHRDRLCRCIRKSSFRMERRVYRGLTRG